MKKIFKFKFLLHKLINILFYLLFLVIGLIIGLNIGGCNSEEVYNIIDNYIK